MGKTESLQEAVHSGDGPLIGYKSLKACMWQCLNMLSFPILPSHLLRFKKLKETENQGKKEKEHVIR